MMAMYKEIYEGSTEVRAFLFSNYFNILYIKFKRAHLLIIYTECWFHD